MGSKSNTWCKKLMDKGKKYALKQALGNEAGLLSRVTGERYGNAKILNDRRAQLAKYKNNAVIDGDTPDKPMATPPKNETKTPLPMAAGWKPQPYMNPKMRKLLAQGRKPAAILKTAGKRSW